jgi:hypothetical protein
LWTDWPTNRFNGFFYIRQAVDTPFRRAALTEFMPF